VDIMVVRELTGGIYFGEKTRGEDSASDLCTYTAAEIERSCGSPAGSPPRAAAGSPPWTRPTCSRPRACGGAWWTGVMAAEFPEVAVEHMFIDAATMHVLRRPADFDVIVTENMFGDILTDEISMLTGSLGMCPSASLGEGTRGLYEPIHGSAPGHRRARHRQPLRHDPERRAAAAPFAWPRARGGGPRGRSGADPRRRCLHR
jgi:3-isopropylmalate dehydrogenase